MDANMNESYSKAAFRKFDTKCGSAIDEGLFDRVVAILRCSDPDKDDGSLHIDYQDDRINCIDPENELFIYEHFNESETPKQNVNLFFWILIIVILVLFYFYAKHKKFL